MQAMKVWLVKVKYWKKKREKRVREKKKITEMIRVGTCTFKVLMHMISYTEIDRMPKGTHMLMMKKSM